MRERGNEIDHMRRKARWHSSDRVRIRIEEKAPLSPKRRIQKKEHSNTQSYHQPDDHQLSRQQHSQVRSEAQQKVTDEHQSEIKAMSYGASGGVTAGFQKVTSPPHPSLMTPDPQGADDAYADPELQRMLLEEQYREDQLDEGLGLVNVDMSTDMEIDTEAEEAMYSMEDPDPWWYKGEDLDFTAEHARVFRDINDRSLSHQQPTSDSEMDSDDQLGTDEATDSDSEDEEMMFNRGL